MNPYYSDASVALYLGDACDLMRSGPRGFDLIIADPPYGETSLRWDRRVRGWTDLALEVLSGRGSLWCFGSMRMFLAESFKGWRFAQDVVWEKQNGSGFQADRFKRVHEFACQFYPAAMRWSSVYKQPVTTPDATPKVVRRKARPAHMGKAGEHLYVSEDGGPRLQRSVIRVPNCHGRAVHPTQKPEGIVEPLLRYSCPPAGAVFDPFAGSGTTLVVAKQLGLRAVGVEINEAYCEAAAKRLAQTLALGAA